MTFVAMLDQRLYLNPNFSIFPIAIKKRTESQTGQLAKNESIVFNVFKIIVCFTFMIYWHLPFSNLAAHQIMLSSVYNFFPCIKNV